MVKPEWGMKRYCQKCHNKYYDMQKNPITCPSCGTEYKPEFLRSRDDLRAQAAKEELTLKEDISVTDTDDAFEAEDDDADEVAVVEPEIKKEDEEN